MDIPYIELSYNPHIKPMLLFLAVFICSFTVTKWINEQICGFSSFLPQDKMTSRINLASPNFTINGSTFSTIIQFQRAYVVVVEDEEWLKHLGSPGCQLYLIVFNDT